MRFKAALHNPNVSEAAKEHSLKVLNGEVPAVEPKDERVRELTFFHPDVKFLVAKLSIVTL